MRTLLKSFLPIALLLLATGASAAVIVNGQSQDEQAATKAAALGPKPQRGVTIINGKKFFSLQNAHRFNGSTPPSGLAAVHHPRTAVVGTHHVNPLSAGLTTGTIPSSPTSSTPTPNPPSANPVLSVFSPEENIAAPNISTPISPATPLNAPIK